jgi:uncharacterized protein YycO
MTIGEQKNLGNIALKKADIILRRGTAAISEGIEVVTHSKFSHAAIVVDPDKNLLIDVVLRDGVAHRDIKEFIGVSTVLRMETLIDQQAESIVTYAEKQLGKPYDFEEMIDMFLRYVFHIPNNEEEKGRFICSTFVNAAYGSAGIRLTKQNLPSPEDIYESPLLVKIADI